MVFATVESEEKSQCWRLLQWDFVQPNEDLLRPPDSSQMLALIADAVVDDVVADVDESLPLVR